MSLLQFIGDCTTLFLRLMSAMVDMLLLEFPFLNFKNGWIPMIFCTFPLEVLLSLGLMGKEVLATLRSILIEMFVINFGLIAGLLLIGALSLNIILIIILYYLISSIIKLCMFLLFVR